MKLIISPSMEKRPLRRRTLRPLSVRAFWPVPMRVFIISLIGLVLSINLYIVGSQMGWVVLLLARLAIKLIPPVLWIGAVFIVGLWLGVLHRVWRQWPT